MRKNQDSVAAISSGASPSAAAGKPLMVQDIPPVMTVSLRLYGLSLFGAVPAFNGRRLAVAGGK
jgi:hypothetical protein